MKVTSSRYISTAISLTVGLLRRPCPLVLLAAAVPAVLSLAGCGKNASPGVSGAGAAGSAKLTVAASIYPVADWVRQTGAGHVLATALLKPGSSPHTYEPTPQDSLLVASCRLVFCIGLGLDEWVNNVARAAGPAAPPVVCLGERLPRDQLISGDPHVWLDPELAAVMVCEIADVLAKTDPAHAADYRRACDAYLKQLHELSAECRRLGERLGPRKVVTMHRAFGYLFRRCGLELLGVVQPHPGKLPTTSHLAGLAAAMRKEGVRVIFAEPQFPRKAAEVLAREADATVVLLDPIGDANDPQRDTYVELIRFNLRQIGAALGQGRPAAMPQPGGGMGDGPA